MTHARAAAAVFTTFTALLLFFHGNRLVLTGDEGIILEAAQRIATGSRPYVDFFGYMSPGSYWLQALVFKVAGVSMWTGRLITILDFAAQCAMVYWLTARLSSARAAVVALVAFAGFQIADPSYLTAQHRWDSSTLAFAGLCLAVSDAGKWRWWVSGALMAAAAWCTPSMVLVAGAEGLWLLLARERRSSAFPFVGGVLAVSAAVISALLITGSLGAFVQQLAWLSKNYSGVNVVGYGSVIGGYGALFEGTAGVLDAVVRSLLVACIALPVWLPPAAVLLWALCLYRRRRLGGTSVPMLLLAMCALVVTAYPRPDVAHLMFVAALPYALTAAGLGHLLPGRASMVVIPLTLLLSGAFASNFFRGWAGAEKLASPVGDLRVASDQRAAMQNLLARVHAGESLYVHPYLPILYFVTQATNPTHFSYLAPGMMTRTEENETLADLQAHPPRWVLYLSLDRGEFLRVFPGASSLNWRFESIEEWLEGEYVPVKDPEVGIVGYRLWQRKAAVSSRSGTAATPAGGDP